MLRYCDLEPNTSEWIGISAVPDDTRLKLAFDNDIFGTYWMSGLEQFNWLQVDFGQELEVWAIVVFHRYAAVNYQS